MDRDLSADLESIIVAQETPSLHSQPLTEIEVANIRHQIHEDMHVGL